MCLPRCQFAEMAPLTRGTLSASHENKKNECTNAYSFGDSSLVVTVLCYSYVFAGLSLLGFVFVFCST